MSLGKRTSTAFVLLTLVFAAIQFAPQVVFFLLLQVFILAALMEFYNLAQRKKSYPQKALGAVCALTISASFFFPGFGLGPALFVASSPRPSIMSSAPARWRNWPLFRCPFPRPYSAPCTWLSR